PGPGSFTSIATTNAAAIDAAIASRPHAANRPWASGWKRSDRRRDGTVSPEIGYMYDAGRYEVFPWSGPAIRRINRSGLYAVLVTNQSGVARGYYTEADVRALHDWMRARLAQDGARVDDLRYCPHHPQAEIAEYRRACDCRKPAPGMLRSLIDEWNVDAEQSAMIGDKEIDMAAARAVGVEGLLYDGRTPLPDVVAGWLAARHRWHPAPG
ncbi:MAG: HAD family hydrolase, partial [Rhodovibrionaceae bacterium]|nr:HAD family hydrolase [Rhodovibrionaceae bacterium]